MQENKYLLSEEDANNEKFFINELQEYKLLALENPDLYEEDLGDRYIQLANFYNNLEIYDKCEQLYFEAIKIFKDLACENPMKFNTMLSDIYNIVGSMYKKTKNYIKAEQMYLKAINLLEEIFQSNAEIFSKDLAISYTNIAQVYRALNDKENLKKIYSKALNIYEKFATEFPDKFKEELADIYVKNAFYYEEENDNEKAKHFFSKVLKEYNDIKKNQDSSKTADLLQEYAFVAVLDNEITAYGNSEEVGFKIVDLIEELAQQNPKYFSHLLLSCFIYLAAFKVNHFDDKTSAKIYYNKAINFCEKLEKVGVQIPQEDLKRLNQVLLLIETN